MSALCEEVHGDQTVLYVGSPDGRLYGRRHKAARSIHDLLRAVFLPAGFPDSVSRDYLEYQQWDTLQAFCSSMTGNLSMYAVLKGVGVGNENASVASAAITMMMRNATGMISGILFAYAKANALDEDAKRWRLFADVLNDLAMFVELLAPLFSSTVLVLLLCFATLCRSLVGVAGGATRAALTQHQARRNNLGDVSAKDGSQETLVNLAALLVGLYITPLVSENSLLVWLLCLILTSTHLYANFRAVTCIQLESFNRQRAYLAMTTYMTSLSKRVPSPKEVQAQERVIYFSGLWQRIVVGASVSSTFATTSRFQAACSVAKDAPFLIPEMDDVKQSKLYVVMRMGADELALLHAYFASVARLGGHNHADFTDFLKKAVEAGWTPTARLLLGDAGYRVNWTNAKFD